MNVTGSQMQLWRLEKVNDRLESKKIDFQVQTKEELSNNLLYFRTCMKLELDRKINVCDSSYIASLLEKKVNLFNCINLVD